MREWRDKDFPLPSDPGPIHGAILKVWYSIEDWLCLLWCSFDRMDKNTLAMGAIVLAIMWIIIALAVPGPS